MLPIYHTPYHRIRRTRDRTSRNAKKCSALSSAFGGIAFRDACNISITRHTGVSLPPPPASPPFIPRIVCAAMDPPARARASKFQPRAPPRKRNSLVAAPGIRGACIGRRIQEERKTSISSLLRWRGSVDEIARRKGGEGGRGTGGRGERPVGYSIPGAWIARGLCRVTLVPP